MENRFVSLWINQSVKKSRTVSLWINQSEKKSRTVSLWINRSGNVPCKRVRKRDKPARQEEQKKNRANVKKRDEPDQSKRCNPKEFQRE